MVGRQAYNLCGFDYIFIVLYTVLKQLNLFYCETNEAILKEKSTAPCSPLRVTLHTTSRYSTILTPKYLI